LDERFAHGEKIRIVDREHLNRQRCSHPFEVVIPPIQRGGRAGRSRPCWDLFRDVRTFVPIAMKTGQGEILKNGRASVLACNDVVHRKGKG